MPLTVTPTDEQHRALTSALRQAQRLQVMLQQAIEYDGSIDAITSVLDALTAQVDHMRALCLTPPDPTTPPYSR